tara:strand:+ start:112 stop:255 length:144 start_codon:yes stop_codon:yes gene_type:complete
MGVLSHCQIFFSATLKEIVPLNYFEIFLFTHTGFLDETVKCMMGGVI